MFELTFVIICINFICNPFSLKIFLVDDIVTLMENGLITFDCRGSNVKKCNDIFVNKRNIFTYDPLVRCEKSHLYHTLCD